MESSIKDGCFPLLVFNSLLENICFYMQQFFTFTHVLCEKHLNRESLLIRLQLSRVVKMGEAYGCTYGKGNLNSRFCKKRSNICPSSNSMDDTDEVIIDCCCEGQDLCNHDMMFYNALSRIPEEAKVFDCQWSGSPKELVHLSKGTRVFKHFLKINNLFKVLAVFPA